MRSGTGFRTKRHSVFVLWFSNNTRPHWLPSDYPTDPPLAALLCPCLGMLGLMLL
jgi:hypothetical protein